MLVMQYITCCRRKWPGSHDYRPSWITAIYHIRVVDGGETLSYHNGDSTLYAWLCLELLVPHSHSLCQVLRLLHQGEGINLGLCTRVQSDKGNFSDTV